jgi:hypothetical protein
MQLQRWTTKFHLLFRSFNMFNVWLINKNALKILNVCVCVCSGGGGSWYFATISSKPYSFSDGGLKGTYPENLSVRIAFQYLQDELSDKNTNILLFQVPVPRFMLDVYLQVLASYCSGCECADGNKFSRMEGVWAWPTLQQVEFWVVRGRRWHHWSCRQRDRSEYLNKRTDAGGGGGWDSKLRAGKYSGVYRSIYSINH